MGLIRLKRQLWVPSKPYIIVPTRRPLPGARQRLIPVRSSVVLDATGTEQNSTSTTTTAVSYTGLTISAGLTNGAACFSVFDNGNGTTYTVPKWGSQNCTNIGSNSTIANGTVTWFGVVNPTSGNQTFTATASQAVVWFADGASFSGVNQTGGTTTFANFTSIASTSIQSENITITTAVGDFTMAAGGYGTSGTGDGFTAPSSSQIYKDNSLEVATGSNAAGAQKATASGTSVVYTLSNANVSPDYVILAGFDLVAASAAAAVETNTHYRPRTYYPGWTPDSKLYQNRSTDPPLPAPDTLPHWQSRKFPLQWNPLAKLSQTDPQDSSSFGVETNPHWRGRTFPLQWAPLLALMRNSDTNAPFAQPETNTHFKPWSWPLQWTPVPLGRTTAQDFSSLGVETNIFYRPRTWGQQWNLTQSLLRGTPQDFSSTVVVTGVHYITTSRGKLIVQIGVS